MADAPILNAPGSTGGKGASKKVKLDEAAFGQRFQEALVHESVRAEQAARRRGTAATKTRGMVSGGGAKPWRQKGTGRARAGSNRSPLWSGGGVTFGPKPRSYTFKVNRKERRAALRSALSLHASRGSLALLDAGAFTEPSTKQARELLENWPPPAQRRPTLVVLTAEEREAALSFRNLADVSVLAHENVGVADLLKAASLLVSQAALHALTARATGKGAAAEEGGAPAGAAAKPASAKKAAVEKSAAAKESAEREPAGAAAKRASAKKAAASGAGAEDAPADESAAAEEGGA